MIGPTVETRRFKLGSSEFNVYSPTSRPLVLASTAAGVSSCTACLNDVLSPTSPRYARLSSSTRR